MKRLRGSQWLVAAALLLAAACGAEAPSTAPDTSAPPTTVETVVAAVPTTMATTTTTAPPYVPPPDPAECDRTYSELVAEETERRRALLNEEIVEQSERVDVRYAVPRRTLDEELSEIRSLAHELLAAEIGTAQEIADFDMLQERVTELLLQKDDVAAVRLIDLTRLHTEASDQLTDWFIDFAGPEGTVRFEGQSRGCVCGREPSVVADAQSDRVDAFLAGEAALQSDVVGRLFNERRLSLQIVAESAFPRPRREVFNRIDRILSERSEVLLQITNRESQRHRDFFFNFHSPEAQSLLEYACSLP